MTGNDIQYFENRVSRLERIVLELRGADGALGKEFATLHGELRQAREAIGLNRDDINKHAVLMHEARIRSAQEVGRAEGRDEGGTATQRLAKAEAALLALAPLHAMPTRVDKLELAEAKRQGEAAVRAVLVSAGTAGVVALVVQGVKVLAGL